MLELVTSAILVLCVAGPAVGILYCRDNFHPAVLLGPMLAFSYVYMPMQLLGAEGQWLAFIHEEDAVYFQLVNLAGTLALSAGLILGSRGVRRHPTPQGLPPVARWFAVPMRKAGLMLAGAALLLYAYNLANVGGLYEAYNTAKGGGTAESGYLRDFVLLAIPGLGLLLWAYRGEAFRWRTAALFLILAFPILGHGLLSARRGPTFVGAVALAAGWYLSRGTRPKGWAVAAGGATLGFLMLFLVTYRSEIYLGSEFFEEDVGSFSTVISEVQNDRTRETLGNEFIYGSFVTSLARREGDFFWGARYLGYVFVRPIPSQVWPDKYTDTGLDSLLVNAGTLGRRTDLSQLGAAMPQGAAPGLMADLYIEVSWAFPLLAFLLGHLFAYVWRRSLRDAEIWGIVYLCLMSLSAYLIMQTFEAFLVRALEMALPLALAWFWVRRDAAIRYALHVRRAARSAPSRLMREEASA